MKILLIFMCCVFGISIAVLAQTRPPRIQGADVVNLTCNGIATGRITIRVQPNTGSPPFRFSIDGGRNFQTTATFSNLTAGPYSLVIRDGINRLSDSVRVTINQPPRIIVNCSSGRAICNGSSTGSVSATASGGRGELSFLWSNGSQSPGQSGLPAGNYSVRVTDSSNCSESCSTTVIQPQELVVTSTARDLTCIDSSGAIAVNVSGGTPPYSFLWDDGSKKQNRSGLRAGTYTVTVSDSSNCSKTDSVVLKQSATGKKYSIGDTTSCGIVFYVDTSFGKSLSTLSLNRLDGRAAADTIPISSLRCAVRYLVCAYQDASPGVVWYNGNNFETGCRSSKLFDKNNADSVIIVQGNDAVYAANTAARFSDQDTSCLGWYLPSRAELQLMYQNLAAKNMGGFANEGYWSSSEENKRKAWIVDFLNGRTITNNKANKYHVRAIRELIVK